MDNFGRFIFEINGAPQKKGWFRKTKSHLAFYENAIVIDEFGDHTEIFKRNITNVYYSAPMVGDYECVTVKVDYYDEEELLRTYTLDEATWNGIFAHVDKVLDCEWYEFREQKLKQPEYVKWFNAINAVIALAGESDAELFGAYIKLPGAAADVRKSLFESWEINVRQDLLDRFETLYEGRSAKQAQEIIDEIIKNGGDPNNLKEDSRHHLEWMQSRYAVAWDLGRMILIASQGFIADFLTYDEAVAYCVKAGKKLQQLFHSWDEVFHHYMQGYIYWSGDDPEDDESEAYQRIGIYNWLKTLPKSPYRIYWDTKMEK